MFPLPLGPDLVAGLDALRRRGLSRAGRTGRTDKKIKKLNEFENIQQISFGKGNKERIKPVT